MKSLCIIPARAGSKRLPGKNRETVGGVVLWRRATHCIPDDCQAIVATDDHEILVEIDKHPSPLFGRIIVPAVLAADAIPMRDVVQFVCEEAGRFIGRDWTHVVLLQPTSPLRRMQDVEDCLRIAERTGCDSVVSVTAKPGHIYERNGAVYVFRYPRCEVGGWTQFYVMPAERSVDIDTAEDLAEARRIAGA
jgi:CMP-N-acetylneuraminic acid synthetase